MKNKFKDFKEYTETVEVNYYSWTKNLFTRATENIFPKWVYYVPQNGSKTSTLLRCCEGDLNPVEIVSFNWISSDCVTITHLKTKSSECISLDTDINSKEWLIFDDDNEAIQDVILGAINPLMIS